MIIPYSYDYHDACVPVIKQFFDNSLEVFGQEYTDETIANVESNIANSCWLSVIRGKVVGMLGGYVTDSITCKQKIFQEVIWYVDEKHRGTGVRLFAHLEKWCMQERVRQIVMASIHNDSHESVHKFYLRKGYQAMETHYIKQLW